MLAFWQNGYSATNYDVLEKETNLKRQSLVYAFGDKHTLFLASLSHYYDTRVTEVLEILEKDAHALDNIRSVFTNWLVSAKDKTKRGCLIVNTSGQFGAHDKTIATLVNRATDTLCKAFENTYQIAQVRGQVTDKLPPEQLARLTVAAGNGALLHVHSDENVSNTEQVLDSLLTILTP